MPWNIPRLMRTAISAELFLGHIDIAYATYNRHGEALVDVLPELMILAAIAAHTVRRKGEPISVRAIARVTHIARGTVQKRLEHLEREGTIIAVKPFGYILDIDGFLLAQVDPTLQQRTIALINATYHQLQKHQG